MPGSNQAVCNDLRHPGHHNGMVFDIGQHLILLHEVKTFFYTWNFMAQ